MYLHCVFQSTSLSAFANVERHSRHLSMSRHHNNNGFPRVTLDANRIKRSMDKVNAGKYFVQFQTKPRTKKPKIKSKSGTISRLFCPNDSLSDHSKTEC